jgi:hypothetical protein
MSPISIISQEFIDTDQSKFLRYLNKFLRKFLRYPTFTNIDRKRALNLDAIVSVEVIDSKEEMKDYYGENELIEPEIILVIDTIRGPYILEEDTEITDFLHRNKKHFETQLTTYNQILNSNIDHIPY